MRYLSLFSGIEACTAAWKPLGWECAAVAEIEPFPRRVLAHHYPNVPNLGDVTKVTEADIAALGQIDLVVFGSPCQDLSVAGKRKGLAGARSGLFFTAINIIQWARLWGGCRFALWENVPGAFSSNKGADFAAVVDALAGLDGTEVPPKGWGTEGCALGAEAMVEWSTLDAQWFGVAQRRRRVFAVADFGNWRDRPPILLEPEGMRGDSAPRRQTGQSVAGTLAARAGGGGFPGTDEAIDGYVIAEQRPVLSSSGDVPHCLNAGGMGRGTPLVPVAYGIRTANTSSNGWGVQEEYTHTLDCAQGVAVAQPVSFAIQAGALRTNPASGADGVGVQADHAYTLEARAEVQAVAVALRGREGGATAELGDEVQNCLRASGGGGDKPHVLTAMQVRRLTPLECERLQAFPEGFTAVPTNGKPAADGPRYKALGNSMCVNVMRWIGHQVDSAVRFW